LNIAEQKARDEVTKRLNINRELEIQRQKEREEELARIAEEARTQRAHIAQVRLNRPMRLLLLFLFLFCNFLSFCLFQTFF
jgi:hypothetical protein